ncbi:MAG: glycosyltransferase family 4 protein [Chloroflexota bacterium]
MQVLDSSYNSENRVAYLSTYPPKKCGIATFTRDLINAIGEFDEFDPAVIAINETQAKYNYDKRVKLIIDRNSIDDYIQAAEYVNSSNIKLVNLQHEFGLFGGDYGENIRYFLDQVKKPVVTTLHTVEPDFSEKALETLNSIASNSAAIVVITYTAADILKNQGITHENFVVIPHGCPRVGFSSNNSTIKESLGLKNRLIMSTFGLLSKGKGIEYAIRALPHVLKKERRVLYMIIGETHPEVRKHEGEKYRNKLVRLVKKLGLEEHVKFENRYLSNSEVTKYLQATDIYITPYISSNQISSGTLAYALGAGKAVVSTPYLYAQETLSNNRGLFCKFKDPASIAKSIVKLLDVRFRSAIQRNAYNYSRRFLWSNVARNYVSLFKTVTNNNGLIPIEATVY